MRKPRRAGRRISILFVAALVGLGAVWGGVALADTVPRDPGGAGRVTDPGAAIPGGSAEVLPVIPPGGGVGLGGGTPVGGTPVGPPVVSVPVGGGGLGGGGIGTGGGGTGVALPSDLSVTKTASSTVIPGGQLEYGISVTKLPSDNAENVVLTDTLPANTEFQAIVSPPGWSCATPTVGSAGTVTCTIASLAPTPSAGFGIRVFVANDTPDGSVITNTANVSSTPADSNPANNSASASTNVATPPPPAADLSVTKSDAPDPVTAGTNLTYTIGVATPAQTPRRTRRSRTPCRAGPRSSRSHRQPVGSARRRPWARPARSAAATRRSRPRLHHSR